MSLDRYELAALAREMAINIKPKAEVLRTFEWDDGNVRRVGITAEEFAEIQKLDFYKRAHDECVIEWNNLRSTADRAKLHAQTTLEELIKKIGKRTLGDKEPLPAVVEAAKFLARVGLEGDGLAAAAAERFTININLGRGREHFEKTIEHKPPEPKALPEE
jgi:hypothetical protein